MYKRKRRAKREIKRKRRKNDKREIIEIEDDLDTFCTVQFNKFNTHYNGLLIFLCLYFRYLLIQHNVEHDINKLKRLNNLLTILNLSQECINSQYIDGFCLHKNIHKETIQNNIDCLYQIHESQEIIHKQLYN